MPIHTTALVAALMPCAAVVLACSASAVGQAQTAVPLPAASRTAPAWQVRVMPWPASRGGSAPWQSDPRLAGFFAPGYDDDVQVMFANPDSAATLQYEAMWVRVIAHDAPSDQYLGILLNDPRALRSVARGDNVVFRANAPGSIAQAVADSGDYSRPGWPSVRPPALAALLRDGIRAYRSGNNGHHMPGIERCIEILTPAVATLPASATRDERFIAHFVLGRCLAEKYETARAIDQFRSAIALDSADVDAQMALLAELSVMTHNRPGTLSDAERDRWDAAFVEQLGIVRSRFAADSDVSGMLEMIFDPAQEASVTDAWRSELPRLRRIGYAVFRWKRR
jgi:hypothetical protein